MNNHIIGILQALHLNDLKETQRLIQLWTRDLQIRRAYQDLQVDHFEGTIRCFMKVYHMINGKWTFYGYGYLLKDKFVLDDSLLYLFSHFKDLPYRIQRHQGSDTHLVIVDNNSNKYLLYNMYPEIVTSVLKFYRKLRKN